MQQPTFQYYIHFGVEDFLQDAYFQLWVLNADTEAEAFWQAFLLQYPGQQDAVKQARELAGQIRYQPHTLSEEKQYTILQHAYGQQVIDSQSFQSNKLILAIAASVSLVLMSAALWWLYPGQETYATAFQETKTVVLSDGSEVTLNANSSIKVSIDMEADQPRQVWLQGEAYFHVKPLQRQHLDGQEALKKFVVHTDNFSIEVLGTIFNASSRANKSEVSLQKGSIRVASDKITQAKVLKPGDQLALLKDDLVFRVRKAEKVAEPAWRSNYFVFQNTALADVAEEIENYYGMEVTFASPDLAREIFTARIKRDDLPILIKAIESSFGVKVSRQGGTLIVENAD